MITHSDELYASDIQAFINSLLGEARAIIEAWRHDYNHLRPHSSLGYLAPEEFAARNQGSSASARTTWHSTDAGCCGARRASLGSKLIEAGRPQRVKGGRKNWYEHETTTTNDTPQEGRK